MAISVLAACTVPVKRAEIAYCPLDLVEVEADLPDEAVASAIASTATSPGSSASHASPAQSDRPKSRPGTFQHVVENVLESADQRRLPGPAGIEGPRDILILSGGSHDGSFGAGFIQGWGERARADGGSLPRFKLVTGISTGSILATPAFLGDSDSAAQKFWSINHESQLLDTYVRKKHGDLVWTSYLGILKHHAVADLGKLKGWLTDYLTDDVLKAVAERRKERAQLLVGVVDMESGKALGVDMTSLAARFMAADAKDKEVIRSCYADVILASSSAPFAAKPVFINNRAYVDGGVRYGVFETSLGSALQNVATRKASESSKASPEADNPFGVALADSPIPNIFIIFNGSQETDPWCEDMRHPDCEVRSDPNARPDPRKNWGLFGLAYRAVGIMTNQLQRFSVSDIKQKSALAYGKEAKNVYYARILPAHNKFKINLPSDGDWITRTCEGWYEYDKENLRPVQFHPHYMKCMLQAGRESGRIAPWPYDKSTSGHPLP